MHLAELNLAFKKVFYIFSFTILWPIKLSCCLFSAFMVYILSNFIL